MSAALMRPNSLARPVELIESQQGSLHCLQACFLMVTRAFGIDGLDWQQAEQLTGYVSGRDTWPYEMFLSFASMGFEIVSIEIIDPRAMAEDPAREIRRVFGDGDIGHAVLETTDVAAERKRARRCLTIPQITFEVRSPGLGDVIDGIAHGYLPVANLDYGRLHGSPEYEGHFVVISGASDTNVQIYDPGPPPDAARAVTTEQFEDALHQPSEESGMLILIRPQPTADRTSSLSHMKGGGFL